MRLAVRASPPVRLTGAIAREPDPEVDVVEHYNRLRGLGLSDPQRRDIVEYLKSL